MQDIKGHCKLSDGVRSEIKEQKHNIQTNNWYGFGWIDYLIKIEAVIAEQ